MVIKVVYAHGKCPKNECINRFFTELLQILPDYGQLSAFKKETAIVREKKSQAMAAILIDSLVI